MNPALLLPAEMKRWNLWIRPTDEPDKATVLCYGLGEEGRHEMYGYADMLIATEHSVYSVAVVIDGSEPMSRAELDRLAEVEEVEA